MKCDRCGADVTETLLLCPKCGNILHKEEKEEKKSGSPNPFCTGGEAPKEEKKEIVLAQPIKVNKRTYDLVTNVPYYLANFIYIALLTILIVIAKKYPSVLPDFISRHTLISITIAMLINIGPALLYEPFFYKIDLPFWLGLIPGINLLVYCFSASNGVSTNVKWAVILWIATRIVGRYIFGIAFIGNDLIRIVASILALGLLAALLINILLIGIKINLNYCDRFGFKNIIFKIFSCLFPIPMMLIVIFDKNRQYTY